MSLCLFTQYPVESIPDRTLEVIQSTNENLAVLPSGESNNLLMIPDSFIYYFSLAPDPLPNMYYRVDSPGVGHIP